MKRNLSRFWAFSGGLAVLGVTACLQPTRTLKESQAAVTLTPVDGSTVAESLSVITVRDLVAARARLRFEREGKLEAAPLPDVLEDHVLDGLIEERLIALEAQRLGVRVSTVTVDQEFERLTAGYSQAERTETLIQAYQTAQDVKAALAGRLLKSKVLEASVFRDITVSEEDLKAAWDARPKSQRMKPERIHAAQILVETEEDAVAIRRALLSGSNFHELARRFSVGPEAHRGGDLGWFSREEMPTVFDTLCFPLKRGEISQVATSQFGYHICKVLKRRPATPQTFKNARDDLMTELIDEKRRHAEAAFRAELETRFTVNRDEEVLALLRRNPL